MSDSGNQRDAVLRVLFICTGNTCRSPMAEAMFREAASRALGCRPWELRENGVDVLSAGIAAGENFPASPEAVTVLAAQGMDLSSHLSQQVNERMLEESTCILTLTSRHRQVLLDARPDLASRIHPLDRSGQDISDPIGGGIDDYRTCAAQIEQCVDEWVRELLPKEI